MALKQMLGIASSSMDNSDNLFGVRAILNKVRKALVANINM